MSQHIANLFAGSSKRDSVKASLECLGNFYESINNQTINGFQYGIPELLQVTRKDLFCLTTRYFIETINGTIERHANFIPRSYLLPDHAFEFRKRYCVRSNEKDFIVKPGNESQGTGISLISSEEALEFKDISQHVVSEYVKNPYLILGHKFDFRLYATVMSIQNKNSTDLRVYLHSDGLARFASKKYDKINKNNVFSHLTNYSLNSTANDFRENDSNVHNFDKIKGPVLTSHKWKASDVWEYLENDQGMDIALVKGDIEQVIASSIAMAFNVPLEDNGHGNTTKDSNHNTFEILGVDVILDDQGSVHLLELQHKPSLLFSSTLDASVKTQVYKELLSILREQCPLKSGVNCLSKDVDRFMKLYQDIAYAHGPEKDSESTLRKQIMARNQEEKYDALLQSAMQQNDY